MTKKYDIIIIGAGLSGLLSASLLSKKGLKVCVLEKNTTPGGMIQPFKRKGIMQETGMNFFGAYKKGQIQYELFRIFGIEDIEISDIPAFELVTDKKVYKIPNNYYKFYKEISGYFPKEKENILKFIEKITEINSRLTINNIYDNTNLYNYLGEGAEPFLNSLTTNKELINLLKYNALLCGYDSEKTSLYLYAAITGSFMQSAGTFTGGTRQFIDIITRKIISTGGNILTKKEVIEIVSEGNIIKECICKDGTRYKADKFLTTLHPHILLPLIKSPVLKSFYRKRIMQLPVSKGSFIVNVLMHNKSFPYYKNPKIIQFKTEKGCKSVLFYTPVSGKNGNFAGVVKLMTDDNYSEYEKYTESKTGKRSEDYKFFVQKKVRKLFNAVNSIIPDFEKNTEYYYVSTPLTFRDFTGTPYGSSYGLVHNFNSPEKSIIPINTKFKNLFLAGQSINFHGMLGVSVTSLLASSAITGEKIK